MGLNSSKFITNTLESDTLVSEVKKLKQGEQPLLVAVESIEHLKYASLFWDFVRKIDVPQVYITLSVGPQIPSHHLAFNTIEDAKSCLAENMTIEDEIVISPDEACNAKSGEYKLYTAYGKVV